MSQSHDHMIYVKRSLAVATSHLSSWSFPWCESVMMQDAPHILTLHPTFKRNTKQYSPAIYFATRDLPQFTIQWYFHSTTNISTLIQSFASPHNEMFIHIHLTKPVTAATTLSKNQLNKNPQSLASHPHPLVIYITTTPFPHHPMYSRHILHHHTSSTSDKLIPSSQLSCHYP